MRLIDVDALMNNLFDGLRDGDVLYRIPPSAIENAPTIDPVKYGKWIDLRKDDMDYEFKCSCCGYTFGMYNEDITPLDVGMNFCPNCGAKMDLEE